MLFRKNNISEELKEKYKLILENVYNENKYVNFEENCQIINSINELEKIDSKFKAVILQSKLNNLKQDECYDLFELNKKYIEEYMELKDDIQMYEPRNGPKYPLNPFENLKIMFMLEKDEKVFSKDEIFFCGNEELQSNFIDVLKYHFIPEVIIDIEKALFYETENNKNGLYFQTIFYAKQEEKENFESFIKNSNNFIKKMTVKIENSKEIFKQIKELNATFLLKGIANEVVTRIEDMNEDGRNIPLELDNIVDIADKITDHIFFNETMNGIIDNYLNEYYPEKEETQDLEE